MIFTLKTLTYSQFFEFIQFSIQTYYKVKKNKHIKFIKITDNFIFDYNGDSMDSLLLLLILEKFIKQKYQTCDIPNFDTVIHDQINSVADIVLVLHTILNTIENQGYNLNTLINQQSSLLNFIKEDKSKPTNILF